MATRAGQGVFPAPMFGARKARAGVLVRQQFVKENKVDPPQPGVELPAAWLAWPNPVGYIGPLRAQVLAAVGVGGGFDGVTGALSFGDAKLIGAAGKVFAFSSFSSANSWSLIAAARAVREVELAQAMTPEARAVWLVTKRAALEKAARNRINAAARMADPAIAAALIDDANFALNKWGHY